MRYLLLTVLFVTSCVTYEPAASGLVPDGGASVPVRVGDGRAGVALPRTEPTMRAVPERPVVRPPAPRLVAVAVDPLSTGREMARGSHAVRGVASWFCGHGSACTHGYPGGLYAAAGPALRVGDWRGRQVTVRFGPNGHRVSVRLIDWCACPHRLLDLYRDAFSRLADPSRGLIKVTVSW